MTPSEAQDVIDYIGGHTRSNTLNAHTLEAWMNKLIPLDLPMVMTAAQAGVDKWEYFPSWSEFFDLYQGERRERARTLSQAENAQVLKRGEKAPDWVYVWLWCRNGRAPRQMRPFPQQKEWVSGEGMLSEVEYQELHKEWEKAGSPTVFSGALALATAAAERAET